AHGAGVFLAGERRRSAMSVSREVVLGVRLVELVIRHVGLLLGFGAAGALAAASFSLADERLYYTHATVEIGVRHLKEPLENPLIAAERLSGLLEESARKYDPQADVRVDARRDPTSQALMRYLDVTVGAKTSSAAESIAKTGMGAFLSVHKKLYDYERGL